MYWLNFLHIYQPVNTDAHIIKEATEASYLRIVRALEEHPQIKFTININGAIFIRWEELGYHNLIKRINRLIQRGQIDLTGTACYHPIIPLVPKKEAVRQIKENEEILKKHFGHNFKPRGFFLPEMAYSPQAGKIIKKLGYQWIILDEIAYNGKLNQADLSLVYLDKNTDLKIIFRSRQISSTFVPQTLLKKVNNKDFFIVTATDGELYGLRHNDPTAEFERLLENNNLQTETVSAYIKNKQTTAISPLSCSWESTEKELKNHNPYMLWYDKKNRIQQKIWDFARLAYKTIEEYKNDKNYYWARWHLVRGLASCTFWWASARDFRHIFGPYAWNPDEIERGINELVRSVRALQSRKTIKQKIEAEKLYIAIKQMVWEKHWNYYWQKNKNSYE